VAAGGFEAVKSEGGEQAERLGVGQESCLYHGGTSLAGPCAGLEEVVGVKKDCGHRGRRRDLLLRAAKA